MAFCLGRPGENRGSEFGFFQFHIVVNLFSLGGRLFLITCNKMVHTLPSSFLLPIIIYHCENDQLLAKMYQEKEKINPKKRPGKVHIKELNYCSSCSPRMLEKALISAHGK